MTPEYCERYAEKADINKTPTDESDDDVSEDKAFSDRQSESDDEVTGHADP
ncbi:hypothetical protein CASFOL_033033 [Castilleja foliolosa]|uniref:Uncharacterized protein n=1 Tax=Castilleja foliolosa TaxID=1961234 RepID=A0ABD3C3T1_9LAMI